MDTRLRLLTLSMISADADYMYPCFKMEDVEKALYRITSKLGFYRVDTVAFHSVFTFEFEDLRLMVMTTPRVFHNDRICYAFSGVLIKDDEWITEVETLGNARCAHGTSTWRNHPKDFYKDLLIALERLRPDMCLPEAKRKLLGPASTVSQRAVRHIECWKWED